MRGRWPVIAALAWLLAGCSTVGPVLGVPTSPANEGNSAALSDTPDRSDLKLQAGDKIHVTVYGEKDLTGDYQVNTGGYVALPLAGSVNALGLTPPELEAALEKRFTSLHKPKITVEVISFRPFYVMGEVQKPGEYPYRAGLNVLSAIAIAGGATYRASTSEVYIQRAGKSNLEKFTQSPTVIIMPGDLVRVPETIF
jgi:protein involved in polysaccharide export with SLBB domain